MSTRIDQSGATAEGDIVGGNKTEIHHHAKAPKGGIVEELLQKLQAEIASNQQARETIESLKRFYSRRSHDGIQGLEAKLEASGRSDEVLDALEMKELFAKTLEKWSLYASAQEIFAYLLAKTEYEFSRFVRPQIEKLDLVAINGLIDERIVKPTIAECGSSVFALNHSVAMGMIYWLAEQCYVRWHK